MFEKEEEQLTNLKKEFDNVPISLDSIDNAILTGFQKAKADERKSIRKKKSIYSFLAAALLLLGLFSTIRISPAFASYISEIPGMEKIVKMILDDKGRMAAVENKYYQEQGIYDEVGDLKVTIDGTISDEMGIVLFYTIESKEKMNEMMFGDVKIRAKDGTVLDEAFISYGESHHSEKGEYAFSGEIEYFFEVPIAPKEYIVDLKLKNKEFTIPLTLKEFKEKKEYAVQQTMELEGQKIIVEKVTIYPLRAAVKLKMDPNNKKQILQLEDLRLVGENNEVWGGIVNGITASGDKDSDREIYLQSNYFNEPKELYLVLNKAQAIDKENAVVVVDTEKMKILKQPAGNKLSNVRKEDGYLVFDLNVGKHSKYSGMGFGTIKDVQGKEIESHAQSMSADEESNMKRVGIELPILKAEQNPITIELDFYPLWIKGNEKIRIK
ncbi:hypothetical protein AWM68_09370 [Fictibacillus phosphorivorans]|uniref:DUF4179 domain-containing protein n=1 Tax=Fictibacillus phosphorivorans TaxID=1221500 RepID=A0A165N6Y5_9BACL|nr:DUF4179 domain-containing protein [Fictibacillus phosphorivorans]KZE64851.1 hypothetical protein AWM68_09370 [Fictibacillus phosphorivorans]